VSLDARRIACERAGVITTESDFLTLTTPRSIGVLRFSAILSDGWQQGRGAFGGLVIASCASLVTCLAAAPASAQEKRFDAEVFQPSAGPRDLVMVQKSEVIGHLSPTLGLYADVELNPLSLITNPSSGQDVQAVTQRLTVTPMAGIGFFNWLDVTAALPLIGYQTGGNLREIGTEGSVQSSAVGDLRLSVRVAIPYLNRKNDVKSGFGLAVAGNVNLPTGSVAAFTSDGVVTGGPVVIADYRFGFGLLLAANTGLWLRPSTDFAGIKIGSMASAGVAAEQYVWQSKGVSVVGEVYGYPTLTKFPQARGRCRRRCSSACAGRAGAASPSPPGAASEPPAASARRP